MVENIHNQQGITGHPLYSDGQTEGHGHSDCQTRTRSNPLLARVLTVTVGGTAADGEYQITATDDVGRTFDAVFDRQAGETNDAIAEALATVINESSAWRNIARAEYTSGATFTLRYLHPNQGYSEAYSQPGGATLAGVVDQVQGGSSIPSGRFVVTSTTVDNAAELPDGTSDANDFDGIARRSHAYERNSGRVGADIDEAYTPGSMVDVAYQGHVSMKNVGAAVTADKGEIFVVVNTAGGQELGSVRGDADGGNTLAIPRASAYWVDKPKTGEVGRLFLRM